MKKKSGFTLAEVLITMSIIGVIAAIVMPSLMSNHTYKTVGVKLGKFASQLENSARAYVTEYDSFTVADNYASVNGFLESSFIFKNNIKDFGKQTLGEGEEQQEVQSLVSLNGKPPERTSSAEGFKNSGDIVRNTALELLKIKDGTYMYAYPIENYEPQDEIDIYRVGKVIFGVTFAPNINGLPSTNQKSYDFVVTELGFVYPNKDDLCNVSLYEKDFYTNSKMFQKDTACAVISSTSG